MADKLEKWEVTELVDDAVATDQWHPAMISEYVYEFKQGNRIIRDLTAASYHQIAINKSITTKEVIREMLNDGVLYTVTVVDPEGQERVGVSHEPFILNGKPDKFCFQKALTKATRNAIKQLVTATERIATIESLKSLRNVKQGKPDALPPVKEVSDEVPIPKETKPVTEKVVIIDGDQQPYITDRVKIEGEGDILRKRCFALYGEHKEVLETAAHLEKGVEFWQAVRNRFGVKSRSTMTLANWRECLAMISDFLNQAEDAKDAVVETTEIGGNGE